MSIYPDKCLFSILLIGLGFNLNAQSKRDRLNCEMCNFKEILTQIEEIYPVSFSYRSGILPSHKNISFSIDSLYLQNLSILLKSRGLTIDSINKNYYAIKKSNSDSLFVTGQILDAETQLPIPSAYIRGGKVSKGSQSNQDGYFSIYLSNKEVNEITISHLGYQDEIYQIESRIQDEPLAVLLQPGLIHLNPIIVKDFKLRNSIVSNDSIGQSMIQWLPGTNYLGPWVESDVLRSFKLFPGISSTDESATRLNIRGGTPDQNLILWDHIPIYHTGHYFGFFSSINFDVIDRVTVNKGYYSPRFGSRSGGLINFETLSDFPNKKNTKIQVSPFSISGTTEFSLPNQKGGLIFAGNKSVTEKIQYLGSNHLFNQVFQIGRIAEEQNISSNFDSRLSKVQFFDFQVKGFFHPTKRDKITLSAYSGMDKFNNQFQGILLNSKDFWKEGNYGWNLTYKRKLLRSWTTSLELTQSKFYKVESNDLSEDLHRFVFLENELAEFNWRWEWIKKWKNKNQLIAGIQYIDRSDLNTILLEINGNQTLNESNESRLNNTAFYSEYIGWLSQQVKLETGIRINNMRNNPNTIFLEPRLQLKWVSKKNWEFFIAASKFVQEIYQTPVLFNELDVESKIWQLADFNQFPVIQSKEFSLGFKNNWGPFFWSIGLFDRKSEGITAWKMDLGLDDVNLFNKVGSLQTKGLELQIKYQKSFSRSFLSYTLSKAFQQYPGINLGLPFLANHHQRHHLNINQAFIFKKWEGGLNFRFIQGRPFSRPDRIEQIEGEDGETVFFPSYDRLNSAQLPTYHRLDLFLRFPFKFKSTLIKLDITLFNLLNTTNIQQITNYVYPPDPDMGILEPDLVSIKKEMLPFTPFLSFRIEF